MPPPLNVVFVAGSSGAWRVERAVPVIGEELPPAERLAVLEGTNPIAVCDSCWILRGVTSNTRYTNRLEVDALAASQAGLRRPEATKPR